MNEMEILKKEIEEIKKRNLRVEADKAWETSGFRILSITALTYVVASAVLLVIGVENYLLSALIPTVGFFLSTLSLPFVKNWWVEKYVKTRNSKERA